MNSSVPVQHRRGVNYHESSPLRPSRDADNTTRAWQRNQQGARQLASLSETVKQLQQDLNRLRRMAMTQDAPASGSFRGEYVDQAYDEQDVVIRQNLGTFVAVQAVPTGTPPETGAPYWVAYVWPTPGVWA